LSQIKKWGNPPISIYEQLITQLVEQSLDRENLHVGKQPLAANEAATWLLYRKSGRIKSGQIGDIQTTI